MGRNKSAKPIKAAPTATQPTGSMTIAMTCGLHIVYVAKASLDDGCTVLCPICGSRPGAGNGAVKMVRSVSDQFSSQLRSNHGLIPAPPEPKRKMVRGKPQCDSCVMGDHGRCTGVGCFCRANPATRDAHMARLTGRSL